MFPLPSSFFVLFSWCRLGPSIDHNGLNFFCHGFVKQWYSFLKTRHLRAHLLQIIIRPHVCLWRLRLLWLLNNQRSLLFSLYWWWRSRFYRWFLDLLGFIGTTYAISSSSRLSALGSLSEPELPSSSPPLVIFINCLFYVNSCSKSSALNKL